MAYSTVDDLKKKIPEATLIQLTDTTSSGVIDNATVERAIRDSDAMIDAYVSRVYQTPLAPVPMVIADLSATIAIANLHRFRSLDEPAWSGAFDSAVLLLSKVSEGVVTLEGAVTEPAASSNAAATFESADRRFSRDLLKGM